MCAQSAAHAPRRSRLPGRQRARARKGTCTRTHPLSALHPLHSHTPVPAALRVARSKSARDEECKDSSWLSCSSRALGAASGRPPPPLRVPPDLLRSGPLPSSFCVVRSSYRAPQRSAIIRSRWRTLRRLRPPLPHPLSRPLSDSHSHSHSHSRALAFLSVCARRTRSASAIH